MTSLVTDAAAVEFGGRQPWPENVRLYQPYEVGQILLPDFASCLSVKAFLRMVGLKFHIELRTNAEFMSPSGKVPFIQAGPLIVSELDPIIAFVGAKGYTLSKDVGDSQKAEMKAYMALVENVLINAELYLTWYDKEIWTKVTRGRCGSPYAWPLNQLIPLKKRFQVTRMLRAKDWSNKSFNQVVAEVKNCCQALSEKLGDQPYFFGVKPTEVDALVYGHLYTLVTTNLPTHSIAETVESFQNLTEFCRRIDKAYFEETELYREH